MISASEAGASTRQARVLRPRESRWLLRRCGRKGHVLAHLDDALASRLTAGGPDGDLLRCLRCGTFVDPSSPGLSAQVLGTGQAPVTLAGLPLVLRGAHGRKLALLRVLALERGGRGLLLMVAAAGLAQLASSHVAVAEWLGQVAKAAQPLGDQIGWDVARSHVLEEARSLLGNSAGTFTLVAWLAAGYGMLQIVEGVGLWGGWRWAEYLAAVATSAFVPLELYELLDRPTLLKVAALAVNLVAVGYLVVKGRLFGVRGGHAAYLAEVRDATLLADELVVADRDPAELTGHHLL
ncbi:MAG TPA: DUF2127 domain-containing protein [Kineosporiaceae bacterium]